MGILDDAIKEHLELKRRRGADPTEVERLEREALGPVRRMAEEGPGDELPASPSEEIQYAGDPAPPPAIFDDEAGSEHEDFEDEHIFEDDTASHGVVAPPAPPPPVEPAPEPAAAGYAEPIAPYDDDEDGPETAEYDVEAAHHDEEDHDEEEPPSNEEEPASEDMLQETPEFLQDAPEHDRLWFEQRPPRDFDFDG